MLLLMVLELLSDNTVDVEFGREILFSGFALTAVGFTTGYLETKQFSLNCSIGQLAIVSLTLMMEFSIGLIFFTSL